MVVRRVPTSSLETARRTTTQAPRTRGAQEALRGLALTVRSKEKAAPKRGLEGFLDAAFSRKGAAAALMGMSMLTGAVNVAKQPAVQKSVQDLFERTAKPASAWLQDQASTLVDNARTSPLATLLGQRTGKAPAVTTTKVAEAGTPGQILDAIESGRLTVEVPLRAGEVTIKGVSARIEPGTVLHLQVDVKDGRLVPQAGGDGTFATLNKPIDGPLFLTADGVHLADAGNGNGELKVQLGTDWTDFIDVGVGGEQSLQLSQLMARFQPPAGDAAARTTTAASDSDLKPEDLIDLSAVRFQVSDLSFQDGVLPASGLSLKSTTGELTITGDRSTVTVSGEVGFDSFDLEREQGSVRFGEGHARVSVSAKKEGAHAVVTTTVSDLEANIERLTLPGGAGAKASGGLELDSGVVRGGDITVVARTALGGTATSKAPTVDVRADLQVEARFADSQLSVVDDDGTATLRARSGTLTGDVSIRGKELTVDATLEGADLSLSSLQQSQGTSSFDLESARVRGGGRLQLRPVHGLSLSLTDTKIDAVIADARSSGPSLTTDLGRTTISGGGDFRWSRAGGLEMRGELRVQGALDDLQVRQGASGSVLDLAPSSTVDGQLRRLSVGGEGFALDALTRVNLKLEQSRLDAGAVALEGGGSIVGLTELRIQQGKSGGRVKIDGDARIDLNVRDGHVKKGADLVVDLGEGTRVQARLRSLELGDAVSLELGSGSRLDAVLDGGQVRIGDELTSLAKGTRASFEIERLALDPGGEPELIGKLSVDVPFDAETLKGLPGVSLLPQSSGLARLTIGGVRMGKDGSFSLDDVGVALQARAGSVTGASRVQPGTPGSVDEAVPGVLSESVVSSQSAASIAGVKARDSASAVSFHPLSVARRLQSGTLEISVPMEGRLKKGAVGVRFEEGTELLLKVRVENGRILPGELEATLSKPADGPLWVTVKGVRMNDEGTLKLDLGGFFDVAIPGMKHMPTDVEGFIGRIQGMAGGQGAGGGGDVTDSAAADEGDAAASLFRMADARFHVDNATLSPGPLAVPGGSVTVGAGTRVSLSGNLQEGEAVAHLSFSDVSLDQGAFAVQGGAGRAVVRTSYRTEGDTLKTRTTVSDLRLDVESAAHVGEGGEYLHLESGRVAGTATLVQEIALDAQGRPASPGKPQVDLALDVGGTITGARLNGRGSAAGARVELGGTTLTGALRVSDNKLESIQGNVLGLDAALHDLDVATPAGKVEIDRARVSGDGYVELSSDRVAVLDGSLIADVVVDPSALGTMKLGGADVDLSGTELGLRLDLSRLTRLEVKTGEDVPADQRLQLDAELGFGAQVNGVSGRVVHR